ncbi:hypothetical protein Tco_0884509 [Tanacetum coccineum]
MSVKEVAMVDAETVGIGGFGKLEVLKCFRDEFKKLRKRVEEKRIGIRALGYRELGCISDMSNSDELRHTDNTTLVPPRLPDTLPQVYHRRRPTLGLLILPSVPSFSPTIRRTARISVLPIEPNLAERARISAINLDDYQLDPLTPPPSPSSPFSMDAYQRMTTGTDPTQREEALTVYGIETGQNSVPVLETALTVCTTRLRGQLHTILEDMDRYPNACLEELEAFMTLWDVKPRVEESSLETLSVDELITQLRQVCEDAEDRASNAQEEARQKRKEALEEVNRVVESIQWLGLAMVCVISNSVFHELARLVPHLVTPKSRMIKRYVYGLAPQIREMVAATELKIMQKAVQISSALTDEAVKNGSIKKVEKRGNVGETSKDKNGRDDNKRTRTGNVFATTVNRGERI